MNGDESNFDMDLDLAHRPGSWVSASLKLIGVLMVASKSASNNQLAKSPVTV